MLLREGVGRGHAPNIAVLEVVQAKAKRQNSDLLPYLPRFRRRFTPLPEQESDMRLRQVLIPYSEVECLTKTILQADVTGVQSKEPEAMKAVKAELLAACSSWTSSTWQEINYDRLTNMAIRNIMDERTKAAALAQERECVLCPNLDKHFAMCHDEWLIKENIDQLRQLMSDQNLQLLPDYEQRISVLKDLGFIDENSR